MYVRVVCRVAASMVRCVVSIRMTLFSFVLRFVYKRGVTKFSTATKRACKFPSHYPRGMSNIVHAAGRSGGLLSDATSEVRIVVECNEI